MAKDPLLRSFVTVLSYARALGRWLKESIYYRAPMLHPLNLLQLQALRSPRWTPETERLFRETVTGIAAGMLTTG